MEQDFSIPKTRTRSLKQISIFILANCFNAIL